MPLSGSAGSQGIQGSLIVLSGPSGAGKGSILKGAMERLPNLCCSVSVTTRPPRPDERDGEDYFFRSPAQFEQMKENGEFLECARYLDYWYGTLSSWVLERLQQGKDVALEIDVQGGRQVRARFPRAVLIFVMPPSEQALRDRLMGRNTETEESLDRRLNAYREERKYLSEYDHTIVNDRLEEAVEEFCRIVREEKTKAARGAAHG